MSASSAISSDPYISLLPNVTEPQKTDVENEQIKALALRSLKDAKSSKREVSINEEVTVALIPDRWEYIYAGLRTLIWWNENELRSSKSAASSEIRYFIEDQMIESRIEFTIKEALTELQQSNPALISANTGTNTIVSELSKSLIAENLKENRKRKMEVDWS